MTRAEAAPWPLLPQRQSTSPIFEATECAAIIDAVLRPGLGKVIAVEHFGRGAAPDACKFCHTHEKAPSGTWGFRVGRLILGFVWPGARCRGTTSRRSCLLPAQLTKAHKVRPFVCCPLGGHNGWLTLVTLISKRGGTLGSRVLPIAGALRLCSAYLGRLPWDPERVGLPVFALGALCLLRGQRLSTKNLTTANELPPFIKVSSSRFW
jgi:hypothetical protein